MELYNICSNYEQDLEAWRALRAEQDEAYQQSLQADRQTVST